MASFIYYSLGIGDNHVALTLLWQQAKINKLFQQPKLHSETGLDLWT